MRSYQQFPYKIIGLTNNKSRTFDSLSRDLWRLDVYSFLLKLGLRKESAIKE